MEPETAAAILSDNARWLKGREETFNWTRQQLAAACEMAASFLDAGPRRYCDGCVHFRPQEGEAPPGEFDSRILCMKGLESWIALPECGDPQDGGFYRPGCREYCEEGDSSPWPRERRTLKLFGN
jgi:hypothetical protein